MTDGRDFTLLSGCPEVAGAGFDDCLLLERLPRLVDR